MKTNEILENKISELLTKGYSAKEIDELNNNLNKIDLISNKVDEEQLDMFKVAMIISFDLFGKEIKASLFQLPKDKLNEYIKNIPGKFEKHLNFKFDEVQFNLIRENFIDSI